MATWGDYTYQIYGEGHGAFVWATDKTKTEYGPIPRAKDLGVQYLILRESNVEGGCFYDCTRMIKAPRIPKEVINMESCFYGCSRLTGRIIIDCEELFNYANCFVGTIEPIELWGACDKLNELAEPYNNVSMYTPPTPAPWVTPVTDRTATSRTSADDMTRIANNLYNCGGYPEKLTYADGDFVTKDEWLGIIDGTNTIAASLGQPMVSDRTSYTNLNKIENIHKLYHDSQE